METKPVEEQKQEEIQEVKVDLKPKKPAKLATGQCVVHWLYPAPKGSIAIFDSISDFISVHIKPHLGNETIITYEDGEQHLFKSDGTKEVKMPSEPEEEKNENS